VLSRHLNMPPPPIELGPARRAIGERAELGARVRQRESKWGCESN